MSKFIIRIIRVLLVSCMIADPTLAFVAKNASTPYGPGHTANLTNQALSPLSGWTPHALNRKATIVDVRTTKVRVASSFNWPSISERGYPDFLKTIDPLFQDRARPLLKTALLCTPWGREMIGWEDSHDRFLTVLKQFEVNDIAFGTFLENETKQRFYIATLRHPSPPPFPYQCMLLADQNGFITHVALRVARPHAQHLFRIISDQDPRIVAYFQQALEAQPPERIKKLDSSSYQIMRNFIDSAEMDDFKRRAYKNPILRHLLLRLARESKGNVSLTHLIRLYERNAEEAGALYNKRTDEIVWDWAGGATDGVAAHEFTHYFQLNEHREEIASQTKAHLSRDQHRALLAMVEGSPNYVNLIIQELRDPNQSDEDGITTTHLLESVAYEVMALAKGQVNESFSHYALTYGDLRLLLRLDLIPANYFIPLLEGLPDNMPLPFHFLRGLTRTIPWDNPTPRLPIDLLPYLRYGGIECLQALMANGTLTSVSLAGMVEALESTQQRLPLIRRIVASPLYRHFFQVCLYTLINAKPAKIRRAVKDLLLEKARHSPEEIARLFAHPLPVLLIGKAFRKAGFSALDILNLFKPFCIWLAETIGTEMGDRTSPWVEHMLAFDQVSALLDNRLLHGEHRAEAVLNRLILSRQHAEAITANLGFTSLRGGQISSSHNSSKPRPAEPAELAGRRPESRVDAGDLIAGAKPYFKGAQDKVTLLPIDVSLAAVHNVSIREALESDLVGVLVIRQKYFRAQRLIPMSEQDFIKSWRSLIEGTKHGTVMVAEAAGQIIGYVLTHEPFKSVFYDTLDLAEVAVHLDFRRQNIGSELVRATLRKLESDPVVRRVTMEDSSEGSDIGEGRTSKIAKRLGFENWGRPLDYAYHFNRAA